MMKTIEQAIARSPHTCRVHQTHVSRIAGHALNVRDRFAKQRLYRRTGHRTQREVAVESIKAIKRALRSLRKTRKVRYRGAGDHALLMGEEDGTHLGAR